MPITSEFRADFSKFSTAVEEAQTKLISFEDDASKVATALGKMEKAISGIPIMQAATVAAEAVERLGGVSKLTYAELQRLGGTAQEAVDKMKALGQAVPTNIQSLADRARGASEEMLRLAGSTTITANATKDAATQTADWSGALSTAAGVLGAFGIEASIGGVVAFTKSVFDSATAIHDMAERLGISAEAVQGFKFAAEQSGSSLDAVGAAVVKLNKNLAEGDKSTVAALKAMGLEFQTVRNMKGEDAFLAITDAARQMADPIAETGAVLQLLGNQSAELLPAINKGFGDVAKGAAKMSNETVDALARAQQAWTDFGNKVTIITGTALVGLADAGSNITSTWRNFGEFLVNAAKYGFGTATAMAAVNEQLGKIVEDVGPVEDLANGLHQTKEEADAAAAAYKKWSEAMVELNAAGQGWQGTLATIDGTVVEAIRYYLEAGVAQDKLATAYGLTAVQVQSVAAAMKDENAALKLQSTSIAEATKLWDEYDALRVQHSGTATEAQIAQIDRWYQDTVAKLQQAGIYNEQTATAVWSVWQERLAGVNVNWNEVKRNSKAALQEIADQARATANYVLANSSDYTAQFIRLKQEEAEAAERAAYHWRDTFDEAGQAATASVAKAADQIIAKFGEISHAAQEATLQMGGTFGVEELTATQFEQMGGAGRLQQILDSYQALPGRKAGGSGITGLASTDSAGYYAMLQEQRDFAALMEYAKGHKIPGFADGVTNFSGGPAIVGERGPELLYLPKGSSVVPQAAGAVVVQNTFHLVDTESNLARRVSDLIKQSILRSTRIS
jgi:hypothetical protein